METSVDQLLDFDAAVRDIAEEPESPSRAPRTPEGSKPPKRATFSVVNHEYDEDSEPDGGSEKDLEDHEIQKSRPPNWMMTSSPATTLVGGRQPRSSMANLSHSMGAAPPADKAPAQPNTPKQAQISTKSGVYRFDSADVEAPSEASSLARLQICRAPGPSQLLAV